MSADKTTTVPTPLTAYGRSCRAELMLNGAEHYQAHTALALATALADEAPAEVIADKLHLFEWARKSFAECKAELEAANIAHCEFLDARETDQKKMPPAVRAAEGDEKPTNQEGIFNDNSSPLPQGGARSGIEAGTGEAPAGLGPAAGSRPASGVLRL